MRFWGLFSALFCLGFSVTGAQAYYLDTPHNESNGIYCSTCHYSPAYGLPDPAGDNARVNKVCLQCHGETLTPVTFRNKLYDFSAFRGPVKKLHASSTTSIDFGTWSTKCTQCHDVHFQGQLDWTDSSLFLATGTITSDNLPYDKNDGTYGSTTVAIGTPVANPVGSGWDDTTKWTSKGGNIAAGNATDLTRGLIFVPDRNTPAETFEIIAATPTSVKVKGKMTTALGGNGYGVIYGQSLKSYVLPNGGTKVSDLRAVKFFRPEVIAGTFGGYVDQSALTSTPPQGLCQVCHSHPAMVWKKDGTAQSHNPGTDCNVCHNAPAGFSPIITHASYIVNPSVNGCVGCHSTKVNSPDSAHAACTVCHLDNTTAPLNSNVMATEPSGTVLANLLSNGYTGGTAGSRLLDGALLGVADGSFQKIECGFCHLSKPGLVGSSSHGGHSAGAFAWDGNCNECHSGARIVEDVHNTVVNGCTICHTTASGGPRKAGAAANGVDGDATLGINSSACSVCHTAVNSSGTIHHDSKTNYAADNNCAYCHKVSSTGGSVVGNHAGDHTSKVATDPNCVSCHSANVGSSSGAAVDGSVVANKIHDTCVSCHATNGVLKTTVQVGGTKVVAMPDGGAGSNNGGGTCTACHGAFFDKHSRANHVNLVGDATDCTGCHNATVGTTTTAPVDGSVINNKAHDTCFSCHEVNGLLKAAFGVAQAMPAGAAGTNNGGGTCTACHTAGFTTSHAALGGTHATSVTNTANCSGCHTAVGAAVDANDTAGPTGRTGRMVHDDCATCHNATTGALVGSAAGHPVGGDCSVCHSTFVFANHSNADHVALVGNTPDCTGCHNATVGTTTTAPVDGSVINNKAHDTCSSCHETNGLLKAAFGVAQAMPAGAAGTNNGGGTCTACHTTAFTTSHAALGGTHATSVTNTANCSSCHTAVGATVDAVDTAGPTGRTGRMVHDACSTCHNDTTGALVGSAAGHPGGGDCSVCHSTFVFANHSNADHVNLVGSTAECITCHTNSVGSTTTAPVDGSVINNKNHDTCSSCHEVNGLLKAPFGTIALAMPAGAAGSNNGGGTCTACHTSLWTTLHAAGAGPHTTSVANTVNCQSCHTAVGASVDANDTAGPTGRTGRMVHDACTTCHVAATGALTGSAAGHPGGGDCATCHTTFVFANHSNADHVALVGNTADCTGCHNATVGTTTTAPVDGAVINNKAHDTCSSCHETNGLLKAAFGVAQAMPAGAAGSNNGGGTCTACHTTAFTTSHAAVPGPHTTSVANTANCSSCHTAVGAAVDAVDTAGPTGRTGRMVHDSCATCHDGTTGALVGSAAGHPGGGTCSTCHTTFVFADHSNADHVALVGNTADCTGCHTTTVGTTTTAPVDGSVINNKNHDTCSSCHETNGLLKAAFGVAQAMPAGAAGSNNGGGTCTACHTTAFNVSHTAGPHTTSVSNTANCSSCHTAVGATVDAVDTAGPTGRAGRMVHDACTTCHNATTGALVGSAAGHPGGGDCSTCHTTFVFANHSNADHVALVGNTADCTGCHNATVGTTTTAPVDGSVINNKAHDTCSSCHETNGLLKAAFGVAQAMPAGAAGSNNGGGTCTACHTTAFTTSHAGVPGTHATSVTNTANCSSCHTAVGASVDAVDTAGPTGRTGRMVHDACATCHNATTGALVGSAAGHPGGGDCSTCHTTFVFADHSNADHVALVGNTADCTGCHNATVGTTTTAPVDGSVINNKAHDTCSSCHETTGVLKAAFGVAQAMPAGAAGSNNGGGTCTACHTTAFTTSHAALGGAHTTSVTNTANCSSCHTAVGATVDAVDTAGPTGRAGRMVHDACSTCHVAATGALTGSAAGHLGGGDCSVCHTTFVFANHSNADHVALVGNTADCTGCHTTTVGTTTTAPVDGSVINNKNHDTCSSCHETNGLLKAAFGVAQAMPAGAAGTNNGGGTCTTCHTTVFSTSHAALGGAHTTSVANTANCSSCHTAVGASVDAVDTAGPTGRTGRMVHDACTTCHVAATGALTGSAAGHPGGGTCATCHTTFVFANHSNADHVALVGNTADCTGCHNTTVGTTTTAPVDGSVINNKNHDTCSSCHETNGLLKAAFGVAQAMPAGAAGTNNGGGTCTACHTTAFTTSHAAVPGPHTTSVANTANCSGCHTAVGASVDAVDTAGPTGRTGRMVHDACSTCHVAATGALTGSAAGHPGGGTCSTCHTTFVFANHSNADHVALVADSASCNTAGCHTLTKGTTTTVPIDGTLHTRVHDTCATCHTATGAMVAPTGSVTTLNAGAAGSNNGGGACTVCHTTFTLSSHNHTHLVTYNAGVDLSQAGPGTACGISCHVPTVAGTLTTWAGIYEEHLSNCGTCHSYSVSQPTGTTPPVATNDSLIQNSTPSTCITCHTEKVQPATHGGHATTAFDWTTATKASCGTSDCHDWANNPNVVTDVHGLGHATTGILGGSAYRQYGNVASAACRNCHGATGGTDGNTIGGNDLNGYVGDARIVANGGPASATTHTEACTVCHTLTIPRMHHERWFASATGRNVTPTRPSWVLSGNCYKCHNDANYADAGMKATFEPQGPARTQVMHGSTNGTGLRPGIAPCAYCHIENTTGASGVFRIKKYDLTLIQGSTAGLEALNPFLGTYTHSIPNRGTAIAVTNSGNCLHCHGATNNRPANYQNPTDTKALGRAVKPRHGWVVGMITVPTATESTTAGIIRLRVGLHPGHIRYRLMSTQPNPTGNKGVVGWAIADRFNKAGIGNEKLYQGLASQGVGKTANTITGPLFKAQWGITNLRALLGTAFMAGGTYAPVPTQSVPYTINGGGGPYVVPINP